MPHRPLLPMLAVALLLVAAPLRAQAPAPMPPASPPPPRPVAADTLPTPKRPDTAPPPAMAAVRALEAAPAAPATPNAPPAGATMRCKDGTWLNGAPAANRCERNGGVAVIVPVRAAAPPLAPPRAP